MKLMAANIQYHNILNLRDFELGTSAANQHAEITNQLEKQRTKAIKILKTADQKGIKVNIEADIKISFAGS